MPRRPPYHGPRSISLERIKRCARIYGSNREAAAAMGIAENTFSRLCRENDIDTPLVRRKKAHQQWQTERTTAPATIADIAQDDEGLLLDVLGQIADQ